MFKVVLSLDFGFRWINSQNASKHTISPGNEHQMERKFRMKFTEANTMKMQTTNETVKNMQI